MLDFYLHAIVKSGDGRSRMFRIHLEAARLYHVEDMLQGLEVILRKSADPLCQIEIDAVFFDYPRDSEPYRNLPHDQSLRDDLNAFLKDRADAPD